MKTMQGIRLYTRKAVRGVAVFMCLIVFVMTGASYASGKALEVKWAGTEKACVFYDDKPLFAFGPMDELRLFAVKVGSASYDVRDWAKWQKAYGMNYVRCYPQSGWGWCSLDADGRIFPFRIVQKKPLKFDISVFNEQYWQNFRQVCRILKEHGIIVHLQLFQLCYFEVAPNPEDRWITNFWNPANNINEFTRDLKPNGNGHHPFIEQPFDGNDQLRAHLRQYLWRILEAVGDLGNVFLDLANEMGDGGVDVDKAKQWINWINREIKQWEKKSGHDILVGMDYTHFPYGRQPMSLVDKQWLWSHPDMELIIDHGEHLPQKVLSLRRKYGKPVMIVNSIDYGGAREEPPETKSMAYGHADQAHRFRRFHWRGMMVKAQGLGGYAYPKIDQIQLNPGTHWIMPACCQRLKRLNPHPLSTPIASVRMNSSSCTWRDRTTNKQSSIPPAKWCWSKFPSAKVNCSNGRYCTRQQVINSPHRL